MPTRITLDFWGDRQLDRTLARFEARALDFTPVWQDLAERFVALETLQFNTEGRHASGGWAPLSHAYAEWKSEHYPGKPILERTGKLRRSLTTRPLPVEEFTEHAMVIGSDVEYGAYHQHGTDRMPQRRPVELTEHARRDWVKRMQQHIIGNRA